jgi:hypothetical protein
VSEDGFEGHFKVAYAGNGSITLETKVQVCTSAVSSFSSGSPAVCSCGMGLFGRQVNPFAAKTATSRRALRHLGSLIAHQPTVVPLSITISQVRIDGELVLNVKKKNSAGDGPAPPTSRSDGSLVLDSTSPAPAATATATAVPHVAAQFKADPLTSVTISSSFDDFGSVKDYLQEQVEGSLRKLFVEDFPQIVSGVNQQLGSSPEKDNTVVVLEPK